MVTIARSLGAKGLDRWRPPAERLADIIAPALPESRAERIARIQAMGSI